MTDISKEAVERMIAGIPGTKPAKEIYALQDEVSATLRAQAARIAELEAENAILRTEKHADAEAIASARNDALREAAQIVGRYDEESTCPSCCDVTAINEEITTLIEGDTND